MFLIKPFSSLIGISLLIFIGWIALGGHPTERIERFCRPVQWTGNVMTSFFELGAPSIAPVISRGFNNTEYGCRYATWRVLYEKEWVAAQQRAQQEELLRQQMAMQQAREAQRIKSQSSEKREGAPQK